MKLLEVHLLLVLAVFLAEALPEALEDLDAAEDKLEAVADEEDEDDGDEHRGDGDVALLPQGHRGALLVGLTHGPHHEHVQGRHDEDG